jgi:ubiquitin-protein ligase
MSGLSPRHRRLVADLTQMEELVSQSPAITFRSEGDPPETYDLLFNLPGIARDTDGQLVMRRLHRCTVYLHRDYPRRPPVVSWLTPIFHPNILPPERNGGVCLGSWSAGESLADVVRRLAKLVCYRSFNPADALDRDAAAWVLARGVTPGVDLAAVVRSERPQPLAAEPLVVLGGRR